MCANAAGEDIDVRDLRGQDFISAEMNYIDLGCANLEGAILAGAELFRADLRRADLAGADLRRADLRSGNLSGAVLRDADLRQAIFTNANLTAADLRNARIRCRKCPERLLGRFLLSDLSDADLRGADFGWSSLAGANLSGADLRGANLADAMDLRSASISLQGALYDDAMKFPPYIDPVSRGMTFVGGRASETTAGGSPQRP